MSSPDLSAPPPPPRRRNRNWIWVFVVLAMLGILAVAINWMYNVGEPLMPEKLAAARELWKQNRPADYDLKIVRSMSDGSGQTVSDRIEVKVRGGQIVSFLVNGGEPEPLLTRDDKRNVDEERRQRAMWDIDGLFDVIEELMEQDQRNHVNSFMRARFDKRDGHLILFTRQIERKRIPLIQVKLERV